MKANRLLLSLIACVSGMLSACETETRVVSSRGGLQSIPGSVGGVRASDQAVARQSLEQLLARPEDASAEGENPDPAGYLRRTNDDGTITLICRSPRHLVYHLLQTMANREWDILYEQLLSLQTKTAYRARGMDPKLAIDYLQKNETDIRKFLALIPMGEATPGVVQQTIGRNMFRLRPQSAPTMESRYRNFDTIIEDGSFKLIVIN